METINNLTSLNLRRIVLGDFSRLRFVIRFSNCPRLHNESVAEHSFYTTLYSYAMAVDLLFGESRIPVNMGAVLSKALMHDVDECFSGDFIRMFKHHNNSVKSEINNVCKILMKEFTKSVASPAVSNEMYQQWEKAKNTTVEGAIVSFADYLSVLSYVAQEIELGNTRMQRQIPELKKFHLYFKHPEYSFLKSYIDSAEHILLTLPEATI